MLSKITNKYYKSIDLEHRKKYGQYMTPYDVIDMSLDFLENKKNIKILEPSCGTGQFIDKIYDRFENVSKIDAVEIDKNVFDIIKKRNNLNIINDDFLLMNFNDSKYDLIIGNPPYFELNNEQKNKYISYEDIMTGRTNIVSLFLKKSIDLLNDKGILLFVVPTSILSQKYYEKIRKYIVLNCNILKIKIVDQTKFKDALQQTMIFMIQKTNEKKSKKYIIKINKMLLFNTKYKEYNDLLKSKKFIKNYDCQVKTGSIVWNQKKNLLSNDSNDIMLVYSRNLDYENNKIIVVNDDIKKQYIKNDKKIKVIEAPCIAINRIIGIKDINLKPVLLEHGKYCFENHINVITGDIKNLEKIYKSLKSKDTINYIKNIIGNTQLSKSELENIVPIFE